MMKIQTQAHRATVRRIRTATRLALGTVAALGTLQTARAAAEDGLQEIVVTAQRRAQTLEDVPVAVSALSGQELADRGIRTANEIAATIPNVTLSTPFGPEGAPVFSIRGVSESDYTQHQSSPIAMYVDEVYKSIGAVQSVQTYDLDRVEVLRGPQGTLYGKNATGGAVSFYTKDPSLQSYEGYVTAGGGNFSDVSGRAAIGGPILDDRLAWRIALYSEQREGFETSTTPGVRPLGSVNVVAGRLTLLWKANDDLTAKFKFASSESKGTPYGTRPINIDPTVTGYSGYVPWYSTNDKFAIPQKVENDSASLRVDWKAADNYTLTSVTGYDFGSWYIISDDQGLGLNDQGIPIHIADPDTYFTSVNEFSQELRIASHDLDRLDWLGGLYYERDSTHLYQIYHFFDSFPGSFVIAPGQTSYGYDQSNNFTQIRESRAAFLNASYKIVPSVAVRAGIRYTNDRITIQDYYAWRGGLAAPPAGLGPNTGTTYWSQDIPVLPSSLVTFLPSLAPQGPPTPDFGQTNHNISGIIGTDWRPVAGVLGYWSISQGYRAAAFNGGAYISPSELTFARPETLRSYEIGAKTEFWDHRAIVNVAVFYYRYHDLQFLINFPLEANQGYGQKITNAPLARVTGGELELRLKPLPDLEIQAGLGIQNAKFVDLQLNLGGTPVSADGNKLFQAPDVSFNMALDWRFWHLANGDLRLHLDGNYFSNQFWDPRNVQRVEQPPYGIVNGRLALDLKTGLEIAAWTKNIASKRYSTYELAERNPIDGGFGEDQSIPGEPRTYGLELTYRF